MSEPFSLIKNSFAGGIWSPSLYGRYDIAKYSTAVKEMQNFIIHPHGGTSNRGGSKFIGEVKDSSAVTRLIPFQFSVVQSYVLEFGDLYMRIYKDGGRVTETDVVISGATQADPVVITASSHGYSDGDWIVISEVVGMTELNGKTFKVANKSTHTFELTDVDDNNIDGTGYTAYSSAGVSVKVYELTTTYITADLSLLKITQSADTLYITHPSYPPRKITRTGHTAWTIADVDFTASIDAPTGLACAGTGTNYKVTAISETTSEESLGSATEEGAATNAFTWSAVTDAEYYNVYKETDSAGGIYGWIGEATGTTFTEPAATIVPDENKQPPIENLPFESAGNYPGCSMFYEQRLVYGRTNNNPQTVWGSVTGSFDSMNISRPLKADDSYEFTINARQVNEIRWMMPLSVLLVGTSGSEWAMSSGSQADAITPSSISIKIQSHWGVSNTQPVVIGNALLFIENDLKTVHDIAYNLEVDGYIGNDLSIMATNLFDGKNIIQWSYQQEPDSIIWCVMSDGSLLGLTFFKEHKVWGWHRHDTDGKFESITTITNSDNKNETWLIVKRVINGVTRRYVEKFQERIPDNEVENSYFIDCGLTYDDPKTITAATAANPVVVTAASHGFSNGDYIDITNIEGMTELNDIRFKIINKATNTFELTDEYDVNIDGTAYAAYIENGKARKAITSVSNIDHLEGKTVSIFADGSVIPNKTVTNGAITLTTRASRVHIGLSYTSNLETLELELPPGAGTIQDKIRQVNSTVIRFKDTRVCKVGGDADRLDEIRFRTDEKYGKPTRLFTGDKEQYINQGKFGTGHIYIRNTDPVPITVLSIITKVTAGKT